MILRVTDDDGNTARDTLRIRVTPWKRLAEMPTPRTGAAAAALGGRIYAIGGKDVRDLTPAVEAYDPASDSWTVRSPLPVARMKSLARVHGGKIYVIGGTETAGNINSEKPSFRLDVYDPAADAWTSLPSLPENRVNFMAEILGDSILVVGGARVESPTDDGTYVVSTWVFEIRNAQWSRGINLLATPSIQGVSAVLDGRIFTLGLDGPTSRASQLRSFDPATGNRHDWLPTKYRAGMRLAVFGPRLYVLGGAANHQEKESPAGFVKTFVPGEDAWQPDHTMPTYRLDFGSAALDGRIYAIGGFDDTLQSVTGAVEAMEVGP